MPKREKSALGLYHVILRGNNKQIIFEEDEDYLFFLEVLKRCKEEFDFSIYAYCLMNNHVHLLIGEKEVPIAKVMHRLEIRFVRWYNKKYGRVGHLFQSRYKSETIEDGTYFLNVLRYIHQNPIKASIVKEIKDYPWSSYDAYRTQKTGFIHFMPVKEYFNDQDQMLEFINTPCTVECMEENTRKIISDELAQKILFQISQCNSISEFQKLSQTQRNEYIHKLIQEGICVKQIARITGLPKRMIEKIANI